MILGEKSQMKSMGNARFEYGNPNPRIHEDRNEKVERVKRLRETGLIIFGLIGFIRF